MDQNLQSTLGFIGVADESMKEANYSQDYMVKIRRVGVIYSFTWVNIISLTFQKE